ncbi:Uncharacterised protein [Streptococcus pneumoniae]|nr:Uncharacterised protein [Streptococcus pneumoniae]
MYLWYWCWYQQRCKEVCVCLLSIVTFKVFNFRNQFLVFFRWFVFSMNESFDDITHKQFTSNLTTKADNVSVQLFFSIKGCCHITNQGRTNTWNFIYSVVDTNTSTTDTYPKISLAASYSFPYFFTKDWVVSPCMVICTKVNDFISF